MPREQRIRQIEYFIKEIEECYPVYRFYFYDPMVRLSPQITIFGRMRTAIGIGFMCFAYNTPEHIEALIKHFNMLVKESLVKAHESCEYLIQSLKDM